MTEEEYFIKNYPDSCYGNKPLSPHWDFFQDGVEFDERQSEKQIAELEAQLEREKNLNQCLSDHNEQLRELIEKMKCCQNCLHLCARCELGIDGCYVCSKWELRR